MREVVLTTVIFAPGARRTYVRTGPVCCISADEHDAADAGDAADEFREAIFCRQAAYLEPISSESDVTYIISPLFRPRRVFFEVAEAPQGACRLETKLLGITNQHLNVWSIFRFSQNRLS